MSAIRKDNNDDLPPEVLTLPPVLNRRPYKENSK